MYMHIYIYIYIYVAGSSVQRWSVQMVNINRSVTGYNASTAKTFTYTPIS